MNKKISDEEKKYRKFVYQILDKLEQRIAKLEKVLASHAKCIGEMRETKVDNPIKGRVIVTEEIK